MNIEFIIKVIIPIVGILFTGVLLPLLKQYTTKEQRENIAAWVKIAVNAAEQMQKAGLITIPKKEFVINFLNDKGIKLTEQELDLLIEAAVLELNR